MLFNIHKRLKPSSLKAYANFAFMSGKEKERRLQNAQDSLKYAPVTAALLKQALADGCEICFSARIIGLVVGQMEWKDKPRIFLDPTLSGDRLTEVLAQELRHYWQFRQMGIRTNDVLVALRDEPLLGLMFVRVTEADAISFAWYVQAVIKNAVEQKAEDAALYRQFCAARGIAGRSSTHEGAAAFARGQFARPRKILPPLQNMRNNFDQIIDHPVMHFYDRESFKAIAAENMAPQFLRRAKGKGHGITLGKLRRVLRAGVDDANPIYLTAITDQEFTDKVLKTASPDVMQVAELTAKSKALDAQDPNSAEAIAAYNGRVDHVWSSMFKRRGQPKAK